MQQRAPSNKKSRARSSWRRCVTKVMLLCDQIDRMEVSTNFVRSMRFRAPALTAYAEVLAEMETGHLLSVAPTNQKLQSKKAVNPNYPVKPLPLRPPGGRQPATREQAREVSRLPVVRHGVQGDGRGLPRADLGGQGAGLPGARQAQQAGRQGDGTPGDQGTKAELNRHGILSKLVRMLFVLGSCLYSSGIQRLPADELADLSSNAFGAFGGSSFLDFGACPCPSRTRSRSSSR